jgi:hypothetical protein
MTEINVIKVDKEQRILTREEREVIYQDLSNKLNIPYFYFANIINLEDETIASDAAHIKPAFTVLLLRKLLEFHNVVPIVRALPLGLSDPEHLPDFTVCKQLLVVKMKILPFLYKLNKCKKW